MPQRKSISKKLRFDIFKRDGFTCQYCGRNPPLVILEVDHIIPVSKKGTNNIDNLTTACFYCNRGKRDGRLTVMPNTTAERILIIKEKEDQYRAYQKAVKQTETRILNEFSQLNQTFSTYFPGKGLVEKFYHSSAKNFLIKLGAVEVISSLHIACSRINEPEHCVQYFCGICWNKIKGGC